MCAVKLYVGSNLGTNPRPGATVPPPDRFARRVQEHVAGRFPMASTHFQAKGFWYGVGENTAVVDLMKPDPGPGGCRAFNERARCVAARIARDLSQDAVAVVAVDPAGNAKVDFVGADHACRVKLTADEAATARAAIRKIRGGR